MGKFDLNTNTYGRWNIESGKEKLRIQNIRIRMDGALRAWGPFLESPDN